MKNSEMPFNTFKNGQDNVPKQQRDYQNQQHDCLIDLAVNTPTDLANSRLLRVPAESSINSPNRVFKQKSNKLKIIIFLGIFIFIVVFGFLLRKIFWSSIDTSTDKGQEYCSTLACRNLENSISDAMDMTADPCSDFYQYACGWWITQHSRYATNNFQALSGKNFYVLKDLLEHTVTRSTAENKAQTYYQSCLDKQEIESLGATPMLDLLQKIGGWNISGHFDIEKWDFQHILQLLSFLPTANKLFSWAVAVDIKNNSRNIIELDQAILGLQDREYYLGDDIELLAEYLIYMRKVGTLLGGEKDSTKDQMMEVLMLDLKLARIMIPDKDKKDLKLIYNKMTIGELTKLAPAIDWLQFFNFAFKSVDKVILPSDEIIVTAPDFFSEMSELLVGYLSTAENRTILANYLAWTLVQGLATRLPKSFQISNSIVDAKIVKANSIVDAKIVKANSIVDAEVFKVEEAGDKVVWPSCITQTDEWMGSALGAMFVKKVFREDSKPKVKQMVNGIREAFLQNLPSYDWLDNGTKTLIKEKIDAINVKIGYPDFIMDQPKLDQYYQELVLSPSDHFGNTVRIYEFLLLKNLEKLDGKNSQNEWDQTPPTVNAYYFPSRNQIVIPAGILQDPFYDSENQNPKFWTFGRFGFLIGHELMHSVDTQGRLFDKFGNWHEWMTDAAKMKFEEKAQCFVDQYSVYEENGVHLDGNQTLPDNIADNGGLRIAFKAYENWINNHGKEPSLKYISLNNKQLFFVNFAQMWCASVDKDKMKENLLKGTHSPNKYRVLGTLSNSEDFAREFNCPTTNSMNAKKCKLW